MQEYMLLIRNQDDKNAGMSTESHKAFVLECETYIKELKKEKKLIAAQPLMREGIILSSTRKGWVEEPFMMGREIQVGYYHVYAEDFEDAVAIAKRNPEFIYSSGARIEVRPVKMKEAATGFVYPKGA